MPTAFASSRCVIVTTLFVESRRAWRIAHLQCNSGQDSLSLARLGATVTGIDISDEAIEFARSLSRDSGIEATFVRDDILDWFERAAAGGEAFDVAFASYGAIPWVRDIERWMRGVASVLFEWQTRE